MPDAFAALFEFQRHGMEEATHKIPGPFNNFPSFHSIFIAFEKIKPIPGTSKKKKKKDKDGHPRPLALSKLSNITIGGIGAMTP